MNNTEVDTIIRDFVASYPKQAKSKTRWREPIVGFASAADPLFDQFKKIVRSTHATPSALLPKAKSVIAFFVPFRESLHRRNGEAEHYASRSWAVGYLETNRLLSEISKRLEIRLGEEGYRVAQIPPTHNFDSKSLMSDWSHRHVAYAAGIGRFGIHNLLITEKGCTGRLGSLVTDLVLEPSPRATAAYCLQKAGIECLKCVGRCRFGALYEDRFDRHACYRQCQANDRHHGDLELVQVCGKCSSDVPCSVTNPVRAQRRSDSAFSI